MNLGGSWAKFLTASKGSIILEPAWDGGGGFKLAQVVSGERVSPGRVGVLFPPDFGALRSFGAVAAWMDRASGGIAISPKWLWTEKP